jgi:hypothetical protein
MAMVKIVLTFGRHLLLQLNKSMQCPLQHSKDQQCHLPLLSKNNCTTKPLNITNKNKMDYSFSLQHPLQWVKHSSLCWHCLLKINKKLEAFNDIEVLIFLLNDGAFIGANFQKIKYA